MPTDPIITAARKWARISGLGSAQGYTPQAIQAVKQADLTKVSLGSTGMTTQEALAATQAASTGHLTVNQTHPASNIAGIPGRFASDLKSMAAGLGIGAVHAIEHPVRDIKGAAAAVPQTASILHKNWSANPLQDVRNLAATPIGKFIPGVSTIAGGWHQVLQHPGFTAADLLPYAKGITGELAHLGGADAVAGSAKEAAQAGEISRASLRAAAQGIAKLTNGRLNPQASVNSILDHYAITQRASQTAAAVNDHLSGIYLRTRAGDLQSAFDAHVSSTPFFQSLQSPSQRFVEEVFRNPTTHSFARLTLDEQKLIKGAWFKGGIDTFHGWLVQSGIAKTLNDVYQEALKQPVELRDAYLKHSAVPYDPTWRKGQAGGGYTMAGLTEKVNEGISGHVLPADIHSVLFRESTLAPGMLSETQRDINFGNIQQYGPLGKAMAATTRGFKTAVFLRPMTVANIAIGNTIRLLGEDISAFTPSNMSKALRLVHEGDPRVFAGGLRSASTDQVHAGLAGSTLGRITNELRQAQGKVINAATSMQRALAFISRHDEAVAKGRTAEEATRLGMQAVHDTFIHFDAMTPIERTVARQIMPFYGFEKATVQYLTRFTADHPYVTSILSKIGQYETSDNSTGLPQLFQQMFTLGAPDANGNVSAIQVGSFNPFRNFANVFSISGFMGQLNPLLKLPLEAVGMTPGGTPELYPTLVADPVTGTLKAQDPGVGGLAGVAESFIPQLRTIDGIIGWNGRLKVLKTTDPQAYRAQLFSSFGIPYQKFNVPSTIARNQEAVYKVAQQSLSKYLKTGDFGFISGYNIIPYAGKWWTPEQLASWYEQQSQLSAAHAQATALLEQQGIQTTPSLKSLLTPPKKTKGALAPPGQ